MFFRTIIDIINKSYLGGIYILNRLEHKVFSSLIHRLQLQQPRKAFFVHHSSTLRATRPDPRKTATRFTPLQQLTGGRLDFGGEKCTENVCVLPSPTGWEKVDKNYRRDVIFPQAFLQPTLLATYNQTYLPSPCILSQPQLIIRFINLGRESTSLSVRKKHKKHKKHKCGRLCATIATIAGVLAAVIAAVGHNTRVDSNQSSSKYI
ncbi:uncharacterized protein LOC112554848 [Pomacea canaliculata]|uniref:uncharacterized protein LOC112554848 n=1 Tax=Pomacea canaliculata TaxID=400727 RepID=UPI000D730D0F|nr:uncharacterized protein LOC112554848 [Pomacea canaliculata]